MGHDECYYDFLKPIDMRMENPWAYALASSSDILTICDKEDEGAKALYDRIGGEVCLYVKECRYPDALCEKWEEELKRLFLRKRTLDEESVFHGFVAGTTFRESTKEETVRLTAGRIVVQGETIVGGTEYGEQIESGESGILRQSIYLPLGGQERLTSYNYRLIVYGSDGEEDEYKTCVYTALYQEKEET